jgi:PPM family protein phosphatase
MADEITAEFDTSELIGGDPGPTEPRVRVALSWAARTDIGRVRSHNEDKYDVFVPEDDPALARRGQLFAVADGMGGHQGGQIASEFALKTLVRAYFAPSSLEADAALRAAISDANALVTQAAEQFGAKNDMGTTLVCAVVRDDTLTIAHVGDSRAFLLRDGERPRQLTVDHSWVEEQVKRGALTREEAEASPYRNVILRSIGMGEGLESDLSTERLLEGDVIVLASDGLTGYLDTDAIGAICAGRGLSQAALALIDAANDAGGKDNITALLVRIDSLTPGGEE